MKKFTRFILGTALFYFVFSFAALYFFIVNDFVWSLMVSLISTVIFVPANIASQRFQTASFIFPAISALAAHNLVLDPHRRRRRSFPSAGPDIRARVGRQG